MPASRCSPPRCAEPRRPRRARGAGRARGARDAARRPRRLARSVAARPVGDGDAAAWAIAMPDVFSIRHTTVEDYVEPVVHEIKVRRADLLADLRRPQRARPTCRPAASAGTCCARASARPTRFRRLWRDGRRANRRWRSLRPAPRRALRLPFAVWMALARATPEPAGRRGAGPARAPPDGRGGLNAALARLPSRRRRRTNARCLVAQASTDGRRLNGYAGPQPDRVHRFRAATALLAALRPGARGASRDDSVAWLPAAADADVDRAFAQARAESKPLLLYWGAKLVPAVQPAQGDAVQPPGLRRALAGRFVAVQHRRRPARRAEARRALQGARLSDADPVQPRRRARSRACRAKSTRRR